MRRGVDFKWFDGFFLSMLATSVIVVSVSWDRYSTCTHPLHIWIVVDYTTVFVFRILMFVDNGVAAGMGLDSSQLERTIRFKCRIVVLSILAFLLYPFLCAWTVVGSIWFTSTQGCLPEEGQKWGFLIWLVFSYCGLLCIGCVSAGKWLLRRQFHVQVNPGNLVSGPLSGFQVLVELIRLPEWAIHARTPIEDFSARAGRDPISYHSGPCLTRSQRERVERAIQQLPKFRFKSVSTENSSCPICLDDFEVGTEVRGLPCAHNFHSACIDKWLRLNMKCPHCRCSVFPDLDLTEAVLPGQPTVVNGLEGNEDGIIIVTVPANHLARAQSVSAQRTPIRLEDLLRLSLTDNRHQHQMAPQGLLEQYELSRTGQADIGFGGLQEVPEVSSREEATSLRLEPGAPIQANEGASEGDLQRQEVDTFYTNAMAADRFSQPILKLMFYLSTPFPSHQDCVLRKTWECMPPRCKPEGDPQFKCGCWSIWHQVDLLQSLLSPGNHMRTEAGISEGVSIFATQPNSAGVCCPYSS